MGCGTHGIFSLFLRRREKGHGEGRTKVVQNYYIKDDHSVEVKDSVLHKSNIVPIKICPYCGARLGGVDVDVCPHCHKRIR